MATYKVKGKRQEFYVMVPDEFTQVIEKEYIPHTQDKEVLNYDLFKYFGKSKGFKIKII